MPLYASTAQIKAALRITDSVDDSLVSMAGSAASELIDGYCGRTFGTVTATRIFAPIEALVVQVDDLAAVPTLVESSSNADNVFDLTWTSGVDYQMEPLNGRADGLPWPATRLRAIKSAWWPAALGEATVRITGTFGWPAVPVSVTQAAVIQASRIFARTSSPLGVAGSSDIGVFRVTRAVDPDVAVLLDPYRKMTGTA
jgi:hypothetical protein